MIVATSSSLKEAVLQMLDKTASESMTMVDGELFLQPDMVPVSLTGNGDRGLTLLVDTRGRAQWWQTQKKKRRAVVSIQSTWRMYRVRKLYNELKIARQEGIDGYRLELNMTLVLTRMNIIYEKEWTSDNKAFIYFSGRTHHVCSGACNKQTPERKEYTKYIWPYVDTFIIAGSTVGTGTSLPPIVPKTVINGRFLITETTKIVDNEIIARLPKEVLHFDLESKYIGAFRYPTEKYDFKRVTLTMNYYYTPNCEVDGSYPSFTFIKDEADYKTFECYERMGRYYSLEYREIKTLYGKLIVTLDEFKDNNEYPYTYGFFYRNDEGTLVNCGYCVTQEESIQDDNDSDSMSGGFSLFS
jgi:hypothetical protein